MGWGVLALTPRGADPDSPSRSGATRHRDCWPGLGEPRALVAQSVRWEVHSRGEVSTAPRGTGFPQAPVAPSTGTARYPWAPKAGRAGPGGALSAASQGPGAGAQLSGLGQKAHETQAEGFQSPTEEGVFAGSRLGGHAY